MIFVAEITIMPHKELLDPQGKTVAHSMENVGVAGVHDVRIGKHVVMRLEAGSEAEASEKVEKACRNLLANLIVETYAFTLHPEDVQVA